MIYLVGSFTSSRRRVALVGDILCVEVDKCFATQAGPPLFVHHRSTGGIVYRRGLFFDRLFFEGDESKAKFRVWPSDVWGALGSRFAVGVPLFRGVLVLRRVLRLLRCCVSWVGLRTRRRWHTRSDNRP